MDERGQFIAALLDSGARAHAAGAVSRLQEMDGESPGFLARFGFGQLVGDVEMRLRNLAEALAAGRPELFLLDVEWAKMTHSARQVSPELLKRLLIALRDELEDNLPEDVVQQVREHFEPALGVLDRGAHPLTSLLADESPHVELARRFLLALLEGRRADAVSMILDAHDQGMSISDLHQHVITRVQAEIGRLWQVGDLSVAEEHLGSRIIEEVLVVLRRQLPRAPATGRTVIVASAPGNLHDIGARMIADHFEMGGWDSIFLGADTPTDALVRAIGDFGADLVAVSSGLGLNVRATAAMVKEIQAAGDVPVLVGGLPFLAIPGLWKDVGANATAANPSEAVREGERLVAV